MQTLINPGTVEIYEGESAALVGAVYNEATGVLLTSAQVDSVNINVFQMSGGSEPATATASIGPLLSTEVFSDAPVSNGYATLLGSTYNFLYIIGPGVAPMLGGYSYRAEVLISLSLDQTIFIPYTINVRERLSP